MKTSLSILVAFFGVSSTLAAILVEPFLQDQSRFFLGSHLETIRDIAVQEDGLLWVATDEGVFKKKESAFSKVFEDSDTPVTTLATRRSELLFLTRETEGNRLFSMEPASGTLQQLSKTRLCTAANPTAAVIDETVVVACDSHLHVIPPAPDDSDTKSYECPGGVINTLALTRHLYWIGTDRGLLTFEPKRHAWQYVYPHHDAESWAPTHVKGLAVDPRGTLWIACLQGVGRYDGKTWTLYTPTEGLPFNQFTCAAAGGDGFVWFGTTKGAIRFDGKQWSYRQGRRWLPDDLILDIAVDQAGNAWFATPKGIAFIERISMTLAEKARHYEEAIDRHHRRTPWEYVLQVRLKNPGDTREWTQTDSDNDGLWTSMYGAGECFAYGATRDPLARRRAKKAFEALKFLGDVTQGGSNPAPPGFVARTILSTEGPNPNDGRIERDRQEKETRDKLWKIIDPRWPTSGDGKWYWKCDTSSDELDGHYFFYGLYYDLVADTREEKARVSKHVAGMTDHLIAHDFQLVDHDGKPTRWGRFSPAELNHDVNWAFDRGLNSLSMLSYLVTTAHITGEEKYLQSAKILIEAHGYLQNAMNPKTQRGVGTGNQSDDEMAFMSFYNFLKYCQNPDWNNRIALALWSYWRLERPERNPFFNIVMAACTDGTFTDAWGTYSLEPTGAWLQETLFTLKRFPLDRVNWRHENSHRLDVVRFDEGMRGFDERRTPNRGRRIDGFALPVDERHFDHWNHDPWRLDTGGDGKVLSDGTVFLLPYYMGLYHGLFEE